MRDQINVLSSSVELAFAQRPPVMNPSVENSSPPRGVVRVRGLQNPERPLAAKPQVDPAPPASNPEKVPSIEPTIDNSVYQIPDSARDNPWASILSRRRPTARLHTSYQASSAGEIVPMAALANPPPKLSAPLPDPEKSEK